MKIVIYTALFGGHSSLKEFDAHGFPCVCFTDPAFSGTSETWRLIRMGASSEPPRTRAKYPKMLPIEYLPAHGASIWIDSTITLTNARLFVARCLAALEGAGIAFFKHPERTNIREEAEASSAMPKYGGMRLREQAAHYSDMGLPDDHVLYAGGVIARVSSSSALGKAWLNECIVRSPQDQISLPFVLWKHGVTPGVIEGSVYGSDAHRHDWEGPNK